jgi:hypothetical protein
MGHDVRALLSTKLEMPVIRPASAGQRSTAASEVAR